MITIQECLAKSEEADAVVEDLGALAEPSFQEFATTQYIAEYLKRHGIHVDKQFETGLFGTIDAGKSRTIAFRADIDALPCSAEAGKYAHLCGHNLHMGSLLYALKLLNEKKDTLPYNIRFIFQPAEERVSGARFLIDHGCMQDVSAVIGIHVDPEFDLGTIRLKKGEMMAGSNHFLVTFNGSATHAAKPHMGNDLVVAAAQFITNAQAIVTRMIDPVKTGVISFGKIQGGYAANILPDTLELAGTFRYFDREVGDTIVEKLKSVAVGVEQLFGTWIEFDIHIGVPPVVNDAGLTETLAEALSQYGLDAKIDDWRTMTAEDFALYGELAPATFCRVGVRRGESHPPLHSQLFHVPKGTAGYAVAFWCAAAFGALAE